MRGMRLLELQHLHLVNIMVAYACGGYIAFYAGICFQYNGCPEEGSFYLDA